MSFCDFFFYLILLPSSSGNRSHLVCWNPLSSPGAGINHSPFHTWQTVLCSSDICMLLEMALLMSSAGVRLMSRETYACTQSLGVCVSRWQATELTGIGNTFQLAMVNKCIEILLIHSEIFSTEKGIQWIQELYFPLRLNWNAKQNRYRYAHLSPPGKTKRFKI